MTTTVFEERDPVQLKSTDTFRMDIKSKTNSLTQSVAFSNKKDTPKNVETDTRYSRRKNCMLCQNKAEKKCLLLEN